MVAMRAIAEAENFIARDLGERMTKLLFLWSDEGKVGDYI